MDVSGPEILELLKEVCYRGMDGRPAWVGGGKPHTDDESIRPLANWAHAHWCYYRALAEKAFHGNANTSTLDLGCGAGATTRYLADRGGMVLGLDNDPLAISFAERYNGGSGVTFQLGKWPCLMGQSFDHIFCIEVLEHVAYEQQTLFLVTALAALKPGGALLLTTPCGEEPQGKHLGVISPAREAAFFERWREHISLDGRFLNARVEYMDGETDPWCRIGEAPSHYALIMENKNGR